MDHTNNDKEEDNSKKYAKKKGVGYGSDSNTNDKQWDVNSYVQNKKNQSEWL